MCCSGPEASFAFSYSSLCLISDSAASVLVSKRSRSYHIHHLCCSD
jgi:hypothetical protein